MDYDPEVAGLLDINSSRNGLSRHDGSEDSDDEIQNWSVVASVGKRGQKDFEPLVCEEETQVLSQYDQNALWRSRNMMFSALGKKRGTIVSLDDLDKSTIYINARNPDSLFMLKGRGKFLESMGRMDSHSLCYFDYEEALYLIERGTCLARLYDEDEDKNAKYQKMLPLSLETVYSLLIHDDEQLDRYLVYSFLKRNGYVVTRHQEFDHVICEPKEDVVNYNQLTSLNPHNRMSLWTCLLARLSNWWNVSFPYKFAMSYFNVFSYLSWKVRRMSYPKPAAPKDLELQSDECKQYFIAFNVWKPMSKFKKKNPPLPDFQVVPVKAWWEFPRAQDIKYLISRARTNPETFRRKINRRTHRISHIDPNWDYSRSINMHNLKYNEHNITFAIVDSGNVNFSNLSDCCFASEGPCWRDHWLTDTKKRRKRFRKKNPAPSKPVLDDHRKDTLISSRNEPISASGLNSVES
ncbi:hypothetical protein FOA43_003939 [Brettanomyces nanus]|uniref:tRNA-splicing endonuclease subunit Sen54 N-terminal domain-containing protein n=1 Tax=Eeniella nana TaxID=13502 RepID=A0A875RQC9_EENNA|nr:uncharacterized protein FOA43_003939 [Brettanomyces nanus]QPG76550.1 hypothetical protein FOA43_003939 [Brettanomyces nanus]